MSKSAVRSACYNCSSALNYKHQLFAWCSLFTVALSDEDVPASLTAAYPRFAFARGFVHAVAGEGMKGRFADVRAYVAGPPPIVDASLRLLLREARLPPADIRYDKFS